MMPHRKQNDRALVITDTGETVRQCAVTREKRPQAEMVRFARSPDGMVTPDIAGKLPGRGVWITATRDVVATAVSKGAFARGFKADARADEALPDLVERLLVRRIQSTLSFAKKAGAAVIGFDQVKAALNKARPGILIQASDGAEDGRKKLYFLARTLYDHANVGGGLTSAELGVAFGRTHVVHAVLESGAFSRNWLADYRRLVGFRPAPEKEWYSGTRQN